MFSSHIAGGRAFFYPKQVWSPAGGWWNLAPNGWQRNTAIAFMGVGTLAYGVFTISASKEVRRAGTQRRCIAELKEPLLAQ